MKKNMKDILLGVSVSYCILGIINIIRLIIVHYFFLIPKIVKSTEMLDSASQSNESLYHVAATYYHIGYEENSIKIQVYILLLSVFIGIIYYIIKRKKMKK